MATAPPSLVRLPVQNVERCTPTFQRGAAAKREAGAMPDLHQNAVFTKRKVGGVSRKQVPPKGGQGTIGPLRRFLVLFVALDKKCPPEAIQSAVLRRDSVSASAKNDRPSFPASPLPPLANQQTPPAYSREFT
jgi:hypothetical protein